MAEIILYGIWILVPFLYLLVLLWSLIDKVVGRSKKTNFEELLKQFLFVLAIMAVVVVIDKFLLPLAIPFLPPEIDPLVVRFLLMPITFYIFAMIVGPSKPQQIRMKDYSRK